MKLFPPKIASASAHPGGSSRASSFQSILLAIGTLLAFTACATASGLPSPPATADLLVAQFGEGWYQAPKTPWYLEILPENRFLRLLLFGAILMGIKTLFSSRRTGLLSGKGESKKTGGQAPSSRGGPSPTSTTASDRSQTTDAPLPRTWFYYDGTKEVGPFDDPALTQMLQVGLIQPSTPIRRSNGRNWINCGDVFGDA